MSPQTDLQVIPSWSFKRVIDKIQACIDLKKKHDMQLGELGEPTDSYSYRYLCNLDGTLHFSYRTIKKIHKIHPFCEFFVPRGCGDWFRENDIDRVTELDWYESVAIRAVPYASATGTAPIVEIGDYRGAEMKARQLDTELQKELCKTIRSLPHCMDLACIPIGGYNPRSLWSGRNCDPADAVMMLEDLGAQFGLAIGYGTWGPRTKSSEQLRTSLSVPASHSGVKAASSISLELARP
ncbi:hypothetical protein TMEN_6252 [Trichophyton mentagrophytes]|nr:hypothetical protein TMEN_6252 [Trichophyton mentagrophytes]